MNIGSKTMTEIQQILNKKGLKYTTLNKIFLTNIMAQILSQPKGVINWDEAKLFAKMVGNPKPIWTVFPSKKSGGSCYHFPTVDNFENNVEGCLRQHPTHSLGLIINPSKPEPTDINRIWGTRNDDISGSQVVFCEGDGGLTPEHQYQVIREAFLLPPSFSIFSGGKSLHNYWMLDESISPDKFRYFQKRIRELVDKESTDFGADKSIHSPAQVMRCPGGIHPESGNKTFFCKVADGWGEMEGLLKYSVSFFESQLNKEFKEQPILTKQTKRFISEEVIQNEGGWFSRLPREVQYKLAVEMLDYVVRREVTGQGQRNECIKVLTSLLNHFGEETTVEIITESNWSSPFWNPLKEIKTIYPPYKNKIGNLVYEAKKGGGKEWIYENSKVLQEHNSIKLEDIFPTDLAKNLRILNRFLNYPDYLVAANFLTAVAACLKLNTRLELNAATFYEVPLNLWTATVGLSGSMKTALTTTFVKNPLAMVEKEIKTKYLEQLKEYIKAQKEGNEDVPEPSRTQVVVNDSTEESLQKMLENCEKQNQALLILRDELSALFVFDQYKSGKGTERQFYLDLWDGSGFNVIRLGKNNSRTAESTQTSISGNIQNQLLGKLMKDGDPDGLFSRFLFLPNPPKVIELPKPTAIEKKEAKEARDHLQQFLLRVKQLMAYTYFLSDEALEKFNQFHTEQQVKAIKNPRPAVQAIYRKSAAKVAKISGILNIISSLNNLEEFVHLGAINQAIKLVNYSDKFTINFENQITQSDEDKLMIRLLEITGRTKSSMSWRDIQQGLSQKDRKKWDKDYCIKTLEKLAHMGYGESQSGKRGGIYFKKLKDWEE